MNDKKLCALLLSSQNQYKKKLVKNLKSFQEILAFSNASIYSNNKYTLINYKGLALSESEIQNSFKQLHNFFNLEIENKLVRLFFVVKFDRIGNMINNVKHLFVKFKKYEKITTVIITGFDKSQNKSQDLNALKNEFFNYFSITTNYILCDRYMDYSSQIIQACDQYQNFSLKLTNEQLSLLPKEVNSELLENMKQMFKPDQKSQLQLNSQPTYQNQENIQQVPESILMKNPQQQKQKDQSTQCDIESLQNNISSQYQLNKVSIIEQNQRQVQNDKVDDEQKIPPVKNSEEKPKNKLIKQQEQEKKTNYCQSPQKQPQIVIKKTEQQMNSPAKNGSQKKQEVNKNLKQTPNQRPK